MSELKDLSWAVQETVEPPGFDQLVRRGVRRRRRRQVLTSAGVVVAATLAVLAAILPLGHLLGTEKPPVATTPKAIAVDQAAEDLVHGADAQLRDVDITTPTRWASAWTSSSAGRETHTAVLSRDGVRTTGPVREMWFSVLHTADGPIAISGPSGGTFSKDDPSWAQAVMVRLTDQGKDQKPLRWAAPSATFGDHEILVQDVIKNHALLILNPDDGTLRRLEVKDTVNTWSPVQDGTGRWWLVGQQGKTSYTFWTDNGGRTWDKALLDSREPPGGVAVSPDGNSLLAYSLGSDASGGVVKVRLSTDRGKTWTSAPARAQTWSRVPVVFNDGSVVVVLQNGKDPGHPGLVDLNGEVVGTAPADTLSVRGGDDLLVGDVRPVEGQSTTIATSTDRGKTWRTFEPR